jgi:folylpolyglutamate synthase/dihydropteroate synthase
MAAFIKSFQQLYPNTRPAVLLSLRHNKDHEDIAPLIVPFASRIIVTTFDTTQDSKVQSMDPQILASSLRKAGAQQLEVIPDQGKAVMTLLESAEQVHVITGSFYLLSRLRNNKHLV